MSESVRECRDIQKEPDMTPRTPENFSIWLVDCSLPAVTMPPRDPNDDDDDEGHDEEHEDQHDEPAVIREPDEECAFRQIAFFLALADPRGRLRR
jgi:hypothetical protein